MDTHVKPRPIKSSSDSVYWDYLKKHELRLQQCNGCQIFRFPASPLCPECHSKDHAWQRVKGTGSVFSWVVFHKCYFPSFAKDVPYNVAMIQLDEGPIVISNIINIENSSIKQGLRVEVVFDDIDETLTIPRFTPTLQS